ncbi:MAG: ComEC/Rec2 family competence protein [Synechococcales cyanobacterium]
MEAIYLLGLAWIGGLMVQPIAYGWMLPLLVGVGGTILTRRRPRLMRTWLAVGVVGYVAWFYLTVRIPYPSATDVSQQSQLGAGVLTAKITSSPRTTRSKRQQIWVEAQGWTPRDGEVTQVSGLVYVTINPRQDRSGSPEDEEPNDTQLTTPLPDLHPSQIVDLQGSLYLPRPAQNPGSFDFQRYLRQQGAFAGFSANGVTIRDPGSPYGGWALRRRIRRTLVDALGTEQGELVSSLVMGSRAADLPTAVNDAFREVGLAHVLAASGFHVSILIGVVVALVSGLRARHKQIIVFAVLAIYVVLTGGSPSVLRATLMGGAAVLALSDEGQKRKFNPLALLLLAAVVLLIWQPNWIGDVGFQLSFMATFGLLVGVDPIVKRLPWMPPVIATVLAVPLAAQFWVFPILLVVFGKINTYFLIANVLTLPLVTPLIIGGFVIGAVALVLPPLATLVAPVLTILITPLLNIVFWMASWPYSSVYTGGVSWGQAILLYTVMLMLVFWPWWHRRVRWYGTFACMAVFLAGPTLLPAPPVTVTVLASNSVPVMVIRSQGQTILVNSGDPATVDNTVLPFLRQQGIRTIDDAISFTFRPEDNAGWEPLHRAIPIRQFWSTDEFSITNATGIDYRQLKQVGDEVETAPLVHLRTLATRPLALQMEVPGTDQEPVRWLLAGSLSERQQAFLSRSTAIEKPIHWLWWPGSRVDPTFLETVQVQGGIATGRRLAQEVSRWFENQEKPFFQPGRDGSLRWTAQGMTTPQTEGNG